MTKLTPDAISLTPEQTATEIIARKVMINQWKMVTAAIVSIILIVSGGYKLLLPPIMRDTLLEARKEWQEDDRKLSESFLLETGWIKLQVDETKRQIEKLDVKVDRVLEKVK